MSFVSLLPLLFLLLLLVRVDGGREFRSLRLPRAFSSRLASSATFVITFGEITFDPRFRRFPSSQRFASLVISSDLSGGH